MKQPEANVSPQNLPAPHEPDEAHVRALYEQLIDGWNQGSAEAFAAPFCDDGDLVGFDGTHLRGRTQIVEFHAPLFDKWLKGTRLVGRVRSIRFLAPDVALMHAVGGTLMRGQSHASRERDSVQTLVAVRRDGAWRLAAFQNTRLRPMGRTAGGTVAWLLGDRLWRLLGPKRDGADVAFDNGPAQAATAGGRGR